MTETAAISPKPRLLNLTCACERNRSRIGGSRTTRRALICRRGLEGFSSHACGKRHTWNYSWFSPQDDTPRDSTRAFVCRSCVLPPALWKVARRETEAEADDNPPRPGILAPWRRGEMRDGLLSGLHACSIRASRRSRGTLVLSECEWERRSVLEVYWHDRAWMNAVCRFPERVNACIYIYTHLLALYIYRRHSWIGNNHGIKLRVVAHSDGAICASCVRVTFGSVISRCVTELYFNAELLDIENDVSRICEQGSEGKISVLQFHKFLRLSGLF